MSKTYKIGVLMFAVLAAGIFGLPSTLSLFSGQHSWYSIDADDNQIPCSKCHGDIGDEMVTTGDKGNGVHVSMNKSCLCHRVTGTGVADGDGVGQSKPGTTSHAAEAIACMLCHENNTRTGGNYPFAGGFNTSAINESASPAFTIYNYSWGDGTGGEHAAHNAFIGQAVKDDLMEDSNEACIACHTRIGLNITWTKKVCLEFNAGENETGVWTLSNFSATGENLTQSNVSNSWTS